MTYKVNLRAIIESIIDGARLCGEENRGHSNNITFQVEARKISTLECYKILII